MFIKQTNKQKNPGRSVGTLARKTTELVDVMEILWVKQTRWKGSKAYRLGAEFKQFYHDADGKRNRMGVNLKEEVAKNVLEVKMGSDRMMSGRCDAECFCGYGPPSRMWERGEGRRWLEIMREWYVWYSGEECTRKDSGELHLKNEKGVVWSIGWHLSVENTSW